MDSISLTAMYVAEHMCELDVMLSAFSWFILILTTALEVNPRIVVILWVRKLRHGEAKYLAKLPRSRVAGLGNVPMCGRTPTSHAASHATHGGLQFALWLIELFTTY